MNVGASKRKLGKPGEADRFLRLMDINGVCHIVFCGRLDGVSGGRAVVAIACPRFSRSGKPCKSRTFQPLTVHSRPPFPFTFCFLPPVNSGGAVGTVFSPGWTLGRTLCRRPHSVLAPYPGKSLLPAFRFAARPTSGTTYSRPRKKSSVGKCGCPHRQGAIQSPSSQSAALPADQGVGLFPLCRGHAVVGAVRPALHGRQVVCMGSLSCVPSVCFPLPFSPKRLPAPFLRRVPALARSPELRDNLSRSDLWTKCPEVGSLRCFPCLGIPFRTVIHFSRCSSSMN